jgi:hypothetical protein
VRGSFIINEDGKYQVNEKAIPCDKAMNKRGTKPKKANILFRALAPATDLFKKLF